MHFSETRGRQEPVIAIYYWLMCLLHWGLIQYQVYLCTEHRPVCLLIFCLSRNMVVETSGSSPTLVHNVEAPGGWQCLSLYKYVALFSISIWLVGYRVPPTPVITLRQQQQLPSPLCCHLQALL